MAERASAADCGHVTVSAATLRILADPARLRRARIRWRASPDIYAQLTAISAVVLGGVSGTGVAIGASGHHDGLMTSSEYAAATGLTANAVRRACREGRIPARKVGRQWLVEVA